MLSLSKHGAQRHLFHVIARKSALKAAMTWQSQRKVGDMSSEIATLRSQ